MKRRRVAQAAVILAIILIPAVYTLMFLDAYWDPASYMSNIPVAVVNSDQGAKVKGEHVNFGEELVDSLKSNDEVEWIFTTKEDAENGVLSQKYYAELIIPENFTENISTAAEKTKMQGVLYFKANDMLGTMATSLLFTVSQNLEIEISRSISQRIVETLTEELQEIPSGTQKISDGLAKLDDGSKQLQEGMLTLSQGQTVFNGGLHRLTTNLGVLSGSFGGIPGIPSALSSNLTLTSEAASSLDDNSKSLLLADQEIYKGLTQLNLSIAQMKSAVESSVTQLSDQTSVMQGLGQYVADPITIESTKVGETKNMGTAMTPFMISLCLYLGGFMIMITIFSIADIKFGETNLTQKIKIDFGLFRYQLIGVAQAIVIAFVVHQILGLQVHSLAQFYGICILGSLAFTTLIQALIMLFKDFGKLLCLLFMMCQLVAGGGIIPEKILPPFYSCIHPYMPMTYTVNALRHVILSIEPVRYQNSTSVLAGITVISALFVILFSFLAHKRKDLRTGHTL